MFKEAEIIDIQHDLAMNMADLHRPNFFSKSLFDEYVDILFEEQASLPFNCRWEYSPYSPFKKKLRYELVSVEEVLNEMSNL